MATGISKEEILKAAQAMSKEDRLQLIVEIAALSEGNTSIEKETTDFDDEVMAQTRQFISKHKNPLKRLAE